MKHLNNSEGTFASTKFYFMEGSKAQALFSKTSRHTYITSHQQNTLTSWNCFPVSFLKLLWVVPQTSAVTIWHRIQWCCSGHPSQKKTPEVSYWVTQSTTLRTTWGEQNLRTVRHFHLLISLFINCWILLNIIIALASHPLVALQHIHHPHWISCLSATLFTLLSFPEVNECCNHTAVFSLDFNDLIHYLT